MILTAQRPDKITPPDVGVVYLLAGCELCAVGLSLHFVDKSVITRSAWSTVDVNCCLLLLVSTDIHITL